MGSTLGNILGSLGSGEGILSGVGKELVMRKLMPKYKHGTDNVPETGPAILHKGEAVLPKKEASLYRALHHLKKGGLHRALGVKEGEPIGEDKIEAATHSENPHVAAMARFAKTMKHFHH